jgi:hypothetical protein
VRGGHADLPFAFGQEQQSAWDHQITGRKDRPIPPAMPAPTPSRHAPTRPLPPYSYVPGHDHPHPVTDPRGHLFNAPQPAPLPLDQLPTDPTLRRQAIAALFATHPDWLYALDLFNEGYAWEAHEAWERFWHALGRTTPEARLVQGLIHLAAACVKIREGKPAGVTKHTKRAREPLGGGGAASVGESGVGTLGLDPESVSALLAELERYRPECWQTSRCTVVKVLSANLRVVGEELVGRSGALLDCPRGPSEGWIRRRSIGR